MSDWRYNGHNIETYDPVNDEWNYLCEAFGAKRTIVDLLTSKHDVEIFVDSARTGFNTLKCQREFILKKTIMERLYSIGFSQPDDDDDIPVIHRLLLESEEQAPVEFIHDKLGFVNINGYDEEIYLLHHPIGLSDPVKVTSTYVQSQITEPKGTFDTWLFLIKTEVLGKPLMELALAIGAVAPVAHVLRQARLIIDLPVISLIGRTTTGKSTCMRLSASMYALPLEGEGIIDNLNSTENAFYASLSNVGVPAFLDESTSKYGTFDFTKMLYYLPTARGKKRCDASGKVRPVQIFDGCVIFTGESSILAQCKIQNPGLYARILEFSFEKWTDDSAHAERITEGVCQNYGTAAPVMIDWILENRDQIPEIYQAERESFQALAGEIKNVEFRLSKIYAMILTGAQVLRESLGLNFNVEMMRVLLRDHLIDSRSDRDVISDRHHAFLEKIVENGSKFRWVTKRSSSHLQSNDAWGSFEYRKSMQAIWIKKDKFSFLLDKVGVKDPKDACKEWAEKGWLEEFGYRHYYRKHTINGIPVDAYCILLPEAANMFEKLESLSSKASDTDLLRALHGGGFSALIDASIAEAEVLKETAEKKTDKMAFAMIRPFAQGEKIVINETLTDKLKIKDFIHATWIPDEQKLLISVAPLSNNTTKIKLKNYKNLKLSTTNRFFKALAAALNLELDCGEGMIFFEIDFDNIHDNPVAVIDLSGAHPQGQVRGKITGWELPDYNDDNNFDDDDNKTDRNRAFLIGDDEEDA